MSNFVPEELDERPLLEYTVSGPYTPGTLTKLVDEEIRPRLGTVEGVSGVESFGIAETGVSVMYERSGSANSAIIPDALAQAVRDARQVQALGLDQRGAHGVAGGAPRPAQGAEDLAGCRCAGHRDRVFLLRDLAEIRPEEDARGRFNRFDGEPAVSLSASAAWRDPTPSGRRAR